MQLEIELTPSGATTIREVPDVVEWPGTGWDDKYYGTGLGLYQSFSLTAESLDYSVITYGPDPDKNNKTGGKWLVVLSHWNGSAHLWAAHQGIALAFLREQAAVVNAHALCQLVDLYKEERDDADARINGYANRWDQEARDMREAKAYRDRLASVKKQS